MRKSDEKRVTISVDEAAEMLGISRTLAFHLARLGELPGVIKLGQKRMVVSRPAIDRMLEQPNVKSENN